MMVERLMKIEHGERRRCQRRTGVSSHGVPR
jgi:hypothetical protein